MPYKLMIVENSHYMAEGDGAVYGEYGSLSEALAAARGLIDADLDELYTQGMTADDLYRQYTAFGRDAYVVPGDAENKFSAWDYAKARAVQLCIHRDAISRSPLSGWFRVAFDENAIELRVDPPGGGAWTETIRWESIVRICLKTADFLETDEIYIFTSERSESYVVPTEAGGGVDLFNEIISRGLFDAELAITAASTSGDLFCWPSG